MLPVAELKSCSTKRSEEGGTDVGAFAGPEERWNAVRVLARFRTRIREVLQALCATTPTADEHWPGAVASQ